MAAIGTAVLLRGANHDGTHDVALLDARVRERLLDSGHDHVAHLGGVARRAPDDRDALDHPCAGVVGNAQPAVLLDHSVSVPSTSSSWEPRATISTTDQRFSRESGRLSSIRTVSPTRALFSASCALNLLLSRTTRL